MLLNSFFFIENTEYANEIVQSSLRLEKNHSVFNGHFPNLPVVPGVCMMQMVKEIIENIEGERFVIEEAPNVKFLSVLNPIENSLVESIIKVDERPEGNLLKISASINAGSVTFFKMKATLKRV